MTTLPGGVTLLDPKLPTARPVAGLVPVAGRMDAMVKTHWKLPPSLRAEFGGLPEASRAALITAADADPAAAFADVAPSELVAMTVDAYVAGIANLAHDLERNIGAARTRKDLTHAQRADDEATHHLRAAQQVAEMQAARDQVLAGHENSARAVFEAFEASLWSVSADDETLARSRLAEARTQGMAAVRALFDGVTAAASQGAKLALLRLARAELLAAKRSVESSDGKDATALSGELMRFGPAVEAFEAKIRPPGYAVATTTLEEVRKARIAIGHIDGMAFRRADRGHG